MRTKIERLIRHRTNAQTARRPKSVSLALNRKTQRKSIRKPLVVEDKLK